MKYEEQLKQKIEEVLNQINFNITDSVYAKYKNL